MSSAIRTARESGYSDEEIAQFLSKKDPDLGKKFQKGIESGYSYPDLLSHYEKSQEPSRTQSIISAPLKGLAKGIGELGAASSFFKKSPVSQALGEKVTEQLLPTQEGTTEQVLERAGRLVPLVAAGPEGVVSKLAQLAGGTILGQIAQENEAGDLGQSISEAVGMGLGGIAKSGVEKLATALRSPSEKLASGLTKPAAVEGKFASKALISPEAQEKAISGLNQEAAKIAQGITEKEIPITKQIAEGVNFEQRFEKKFGNLRKAAAKFRPEIDITPISELTSKTIKNYRGIPSLHDEGKKVVREINAFHNRPQTRLDNLLRIYRSNNRKIKDIYETSKLTGKKQEYVDFLVDMNKAISQSIENTLPKESLWVKEFKEMNSEYRQFKNSLKSMQMLKPILGGNATPASLEKLATDSKTLEKLKMSLGEKGAQEISQLSKDLKQATESIKRISVKKFNALDNVLPLSIFIPGAHPVGTIFGAKKVYDWARRGYGYFLTTPSRRKAYGDVIKAIHSQDRGAYVKSAINLLKEIGFSDSEIMEMISKNQK